MKRGRFIIVLLAVIGSLVLLALVEALWAVSTYRDMRQKYTQQLESIIEEVRWQYVTPSGSQTFSIGSIERLYTIAQDELRTAGLHTDHKVEVLSTTDTTPIVLMAKGGENLGSEQLCVEHTLTPIILRLTVNDPHTAIMRNMRLTLLLQLLSIAVITIAFILLLRTLFRAKSIEEIRRDLTHNITHELKTPIAAAYAATDALITMPEISEDAAQRNDYLKMAQAELQRLGAMVEEILRSSTEEYSTAALRYESCDIKAIVAEVRTTLDMKYSSRGTQWVIDIEQNAHITADRFHLMGIISALADNAIKYCDKAPRVKIEATTRGSYTYISIEDNGKGIPRREQKHIFEKFYRISTGNRHDTKGYGLGLYYVKCMVKRHGGSITLRSEMGQGTCFTIKLPRYEQ